MSDFQRRVIVRLLSVVAATEQLDRVREAQLNAISNVFRLPAMTESDIAPLFELPTSTLNAQDDDYLDGLREALDDPFQTGDDRG